MICRASVVWGTLFCNAPISTWPRMRWNVRLGDYLSPTTVDWPGKCAMIIWFAGCNFRCRYCQNASIVPPGSGRECALDELRSAIKDNIVWIDGVVFSGGEPTLQEEALTRLSAYVKERKRGVLVDTNGSRPEVLERMLERGLVDQVSLDLKAAPEKYPQVTGTSPAAAAKVLESLKLSLGSKAVTEVRTTVVPGLVGVKDIESIARLAKDCDVYYLQQFRPEGDLLDKSLASLRPPTHRELMRLGAIAKRHMAKVGVKTREFGVQYV